MIFRIYNVKRSWAFMLSLHSFGPHFRELKIILLFCQFLDDKFLRRIKGLFLYHYLQVCFPECYDVKWLKQQGVML